MNDEEIRARAELLSIQMSAAIQERAMDLLKTTVLDNGITMTTDQELVAEAAIHATYGVTMQVCQEFGLLA